MNGVRRRLNQTLSDGELPLPIGECVEENLGLIVGGMSERDRVRIDSRSSLVQEPMASVPRSLFHAAAFTREIVRDGTDLHGKTQRRGELLNPRGIRIAGRSAQLVVEMRDVQ